MFKDVFKSANKEIQTPEELKRLTLQRALNDSPNKNYRKRKLIRFGLPAGIATAALACGLALVLSINGTVAPTLSSVYALGTPQYPSPIAFDDYETKNSHFEDIDETYLQGVRDFSFNSASTILNKEDTTENSLYSPISLYMALTMLAETTYGSTRGEILNLLETNDMSLISSETPKLFRSLYTDNEIGKLNLANSIWLSNSYDFNKDTINKLTSNYYAHSFSVDFGDSSTSKSISDWINKYTGGKLKAASDDFKPNPSQVMSIINTIYFYDQWQTNFDPALTKADDFSLTDGTTTSCDFMNTQTTQSFSKGHSYTSASLNFKNNCSMVFVLPDEGVSPYDIINNPDTLAKAVNYTGTPNEKYGQVTFEIPKFNFSNKLDLRNDIKALGIEEAFTSSADFSPLTDSNLFVSDVLQSAAISIDEIGCEAAAYTKIDMYGSAPPTDKADMILNRPFIFAIKDSNSIPLFIGIINNPSK
ncbi:MAG: serpin family protein [Clostridium sp.]|nr:serpin family protein [Clostridium sp.]MDU7084502.1 serpin family protein [Clostridium sp.]